jgi:hypothetical protein
MRALTALLVCLLVLPAWGEETTVYKRVRPDGTIEFSDTPIPGGEAIKVQQVPTYKLPPIPKPPQKSAEQPEADVAYSAVSVTSPVQDGTLFFDEAGLPVSVEVQPALKKGHSVVIYLDGQKAAVGASTSFTLKEVFRGSHTVAAAVVNAKGAEQLRSSAVTFNVVQHTQNPATPPKKSR